MSTQPQSITYHQPNWYVENVYQTVNNYLPPEQQPLWIDVPSLPAHFLGRDAIVADLSARLTGGGSVALSAEGKPGVGKTTLAVALAHHREVLTHFSDGVLWAGLGPQPDLPSRLARWADALGVDVSDRPTVEARAQAVRDAIGHRKLLLVIDDAWGLEAAEHLRCGGPNCAHLLTSRDQGLAFAFAGRSERVEELTPADALELLRRLAPKAVAVDESQAAGLLAAVGYLPLAVELLGGYLAAGASARFADASRSALADLTDPARRLALASRRLGDGTGKPVSLQETIALSIDGLAEESAAAVDVFYSLGAFAAKPANFDLAAAQAVAECDGEDAGTDALALLIERNLLEQDGDESLALHQTLADVARIHTPVEAVTRHWEYYLKRVNADPENWQAIEAIYPQLQWGWQKIPHNHPVMIDFVNVLAVFQTRRGLWKDRMAWLPLSLATAANWKDIQSQDRLLHELGIGYSVLGENEAALTHYLEALPLSRQLDDKGGEATTLCSIGRIYRTLGKVEMALETLEHALSLSRQANAQSVQAVILNNIGGIYNTLGKNSEAINIYENALSLSQSIGDRSVEADTLLNLGNVYHGFGEMVKALDYFEQAVQIARRLGNRSNEAATLNSIAQTRLALGDGKIALGLFEQVWTIFFEIADGEGQAVTLSNIGLVYETLGDNQRAFEYFSKSYTFFIQSHNISGQATALNNMAAIHGSWGNVTKALDYYEQALSLIRQNNMPEKEASILDGIGHVYQSQGELQYSGPQCQDHETREIRYGVGVRKGTDFVCSRRPSPSQAGVSTEATGLSRAGEGVGEAASDHPFPGSSRPLTGQRPVLCCGPDGRGRRRAVPLLFEFRAGAGCCSPGTRAITERFLAGKHRLACDSPGSGESAGGCRNRSSVPARSGGQAQSHSP